MTIENTSGAALNRHDGDAPGLATSAENEALEHLSRSLSFALTDYDALSRAMVTAIRHLMVNWLIRSIRDSCALLDCLDKNVDKEASWDARTLRDFREFVGGLVVDPFGQKTAWIFAESGSWSELRSHWHDIEETLNAFSSNSLAAIHEAVGNLKTQHLETGTASLKKRLSDAVAESHMLSVLAEYPPNGRVNSGYQEAIVRAALDQIQSAAVTTRESLLARIDQLNHLKGRLTTELGLISQEERENRPQKPR